MPTTTAPEPHPLLAALLFSFTNPDQLARGPVHVLRSIRIARDMLRRYEWEVARAAVESGTSYSELGAALGMSKQGAARRYGAAPPNVTEE